MQTNLMSIKFLAFGLLVFCLTLPVFAFGNREKKTEEKPAAVRVTGLVRLVGNAPFSELVISDSENAWYIAEDEYNKLFNFQQQVVTVEGEETVMELTFANGRPAGSRRELRNIKVFPVVSDELSAGQ